MLYCGHMKSERHWLEIRGTKVRTKLAENVAAVSQYLPRTCAFSHAHLQERRGGHVLGLEGHAYLLYGIKA